jgi:hypothetical protein
MIKLRILVHDAVYVGKLLPMFLKSVLPPD